MFPMMIVGPTRGRAEGDGGPTANAASNAIQVAMTTLRGSAALGWRGWRYSTGLCAVPQRRSRLLADFARRQLLSSILLSAAPVLRGTLNAVRALIQVRG